MLGEKYIYNQKKEAKIQNSELYIRMAELFFLFEKKIKEKWKYLLFSYVALKSFIQQMKFLNAKTIWE